MIKREKSERRIALMAVMLPSILLFLMAFLVALRLETRSSIAIFLGAVGIAFVFQECVRHHYKRKHRRYRGPTHT